jgi:hypothetical protein
MQATLAFATVPGAAPGVQRAARAAGVVGRTEIEELRRALALATELAERAERRLRARIIELTWPATLGAIAGGFAAVVLLRLAGA